MKKSKPYNLSPARGQALLNFEGRRFPDKLDVFETEVIETVRKKQSKAQSLLSEESDLNADFRNLLIQGDCLSACAYLKSRSIKVDLVYIDPPFASGANYAKKIYLRNGGKSQIEADDNTIGEEVMYGDIWQKEDYLNWLYERLLVIKDVMNETASIYVHLDWHIGHYVKILMDEIFGEENFRNEIIWHYPDNFQGNVNRYPINHNVIFYYVKTADNFVYKRLQEKLDKKVKRPTRIWDKTTQKLEIDRDHNGAPVYKEYSEKFIDDVWRIAQRPVVVPGNKEHTGYTTQKPEALLERIIKASSDEGMIVADFFSGSGTTTKVTSDLNRKFVACDIGINALQTTRDRLVKAGANFDILKINDGLRLFRNPAQTTAKIFSIIDGFRSRTDLDLNDFWDGGIAQAKGSYTPVKFSGIHDKLTKELLDVYLEEIYKLEDTDSASEVVIIYAHKDVDIDQASLDKRLKRIAKTEIQVKLVSLDSLLGEKKDALFTPDNADIKITKKGNKYKVEIKKFYSPYLKNKIDEYNAKKVKSGTIVKIGNAGLEMIEAVQFDTTCRKVWKSNSDLEDKAGVKDRVKAVYTLATSNFRMKIRNIAGDEIIIDSKEISG